MGGLSIWHWAIVLVVVLLLFGSGKVSNLMGDFAKGIKSFKKNMAEDDASMEAIRPSPRRHDRGAGDARRDHDRNYAGARDDPRLTPPNRQAPNRHALAHRPGMTWHGLGAPRPLMPISAIVSATASMAAVMSVSVTAPMQPTRNVSASASRPGKMT